MSAVTTDPVDIRLTCRLCACTLMLLCTLFLGNNGVDTQSLTERNVFASGTG